MKTIIEVEKLFTCRDKAEEYAARHNTKVIDTPDYIDCSDRYPYMVVSYKYETL